MNKRIYVVISIICYIFSLLLVILSKFNVFFLCILNLLVSIFVISRCRFSIISILSVLSNYPIFPLMWKYYFNQGVSSLASHYTLNMEQMLIGILIFNVISIIFVYFTDFIKREEKLLKFEYNMSTLQEVFFAMISIICLIIFNPSIPFFSGDSVSYRPQSLLPGDAWNYLMICSLGFLVSSHNSFNFKKMAFYTLIISWSILNSNRVDVIGILILLFIRYVNWREIGILKKTFIFLTLIVVLSFNSYLGFYRIDDQLRDKNLFISFFDNFGYALMSLTNQNTAADIIHIYNTAFHYVKEYGYLYGKTYLMYIISFFPFASNNFSDQYLFTEVLREKYMNYGGGYFLTEPYLNFGYIGIFIYSIFFHFLLYILVKRANLISFIYYFVCFAAIFRIQWYGLIYIERSFLQIIPFLLLVNLIVFNRKININIPNKKLVQ